jgi:hypothetical protein
VVLALGACESNLDTNMSASASGALGWPMPWWSPPSSSGKPAAPWTFPSVFTWPTSPAPTSTSTTCTPACSNGQVCTNGACACPHAGDVMCLKGCTNPKTDNFACGCTAGGIGAICKVGAECCGGKCVSCPTGQKIDPTTCACGSGVTDAPALYLLPNASKNMYFGKESDLKKRTRCSFVGGGVDCKPTDLVEYKKLVDYAGSNEKTQEAACAAFSTKHFYPIGIGWKAKFKANGETYGLWDSTTEFLKKCVPDGPA